MSKRYKPVGWRGEPHRHYLAAKGIKTRYNAGKYKDGMWAHKPGHGDMDGERREFFTEGELPDTAKKYVDPQGNIVAYEDPVSGDAGAIADDMLRKANKQGIKLMEDDLAMKSEMKSAPAENTVMEDVTDIPREVTRDMQFENNFKLSDAATMPGSLAKDAGSAIGDMVRFAKDVTRQ